MKVLMLQFTQFTFDIHNFTMRRFIFMERTSSSSPDMGTYLALPSVSFKALSFALLFGFLVRPQKSLKYRIKHFTSNDSDSVNGAIHPSTSRAGAALMMHRSFSMCGADRKVAFSITVWHLWIWRNDSI
ncbi:uncharacterized protein [Euphorbia lathyris]|uniref:uncharacterized protein n=1 Tax=Euphorbia lathyris TaxID=212925 RepID=UPI003313506F